MTRFPFLVCILLVLICCLDTAAQRKSHFKSRKRSPNLYVGPEIIKVNHSILLKTDIPQLPNQRLAQTGVMFGAMVGHRTTRLRVRKGVLASDANAAENIQTTLAGGMITFFPLQVVSRRLRLIEPYALLGVTRAKYDFFGNYVPVRPIALSTPPEADCFCPCCSKQSLPLDPDAGSKESVIAPSEEPTPLPDGSHIGAITTRNLNAGFGIETHIQAKSIFLHVFAEGNYLLSGRISENNAAFAGTSVTAPFEVRFGISAGISK